MEAKLFWLGVELMCWAYFLKEVFKKKLWEKKSILFYLVHVIFWSNAGLMVWAFFLTMRMNKEFNEILGTILWLSAGTVLIACAWAFVRLYFMQLKAQTLSEAQEKKNHWMARVLHEEKEWIDTGFSAIFMATFIMYFIVQAFKIPSGSMRSTLLEGDHLFVNKFVYGVRIPLTTKKILIFKKVKHGDIVVFRFPSTDKESRHYGKDFIKRAIGLPGDTIEIKDKVVYRNGEALTEPYAQWIDRRIFQRWPMYKTQEEYQHAWENGQLGDMVRDNFGPIVVPQNHFFVMGDNRDASYDSRFWGPMPFPYLKGKAWILYWPIKRIKIIK